VIRECRLCHKLVDFNAEWCDHETMEESAWIDIRERGVAFSRDAAAIDAIIDKAHDKIVNDAVEQAATELGYHAGKALADSWRKILDEDL
jgi:hypothetical protein